MKRSRIVGTAALIVLIAGAPGAALSQTIVARPEAAIQTQGAPALTDVRERLSEVGRRLREAKLASYTSPLPQEDYIIYAAWALDANRLRTEHAAGVGADDDQSLYDELPEPENPQHALRVRLRELAASLCGLAIYA